MEGQQLKNHYQTLATHEDRLKQAKKEQQQVYRGVLDSQVHFTKEVNSNYGNMTSVEKRLNKDDLLAYKVYDRNQYAMIPGHKHEPTLTKPNYNSAYGKGNF